MDLTDQSCIAPVKSSALSVVRCGEKGVTPAVCEVCGLAFWSCGLAHYAPAAARAAFHQLREHPETMPRTLEALRRNPEKRREFELLARQHPDDYGKLLAALGPWLVPSEPSE